MKYGRKKIKVFKKILYAISSKDYIQPFTPTQVLTSILIYMHYEKQGNIHEIPAKDS